MPETPSYQAPIGTRDVLPPESARWAALIGRFADQAARYGYGLVHGPLFEDLGVFARIGEGTDIVSKEMYDFEDKGGRHLALRPEGTASVVRAYVQHRPTPPFKAWYATPVFRYESPQAGRYRQHHQLGIEAIGVADPDLDVEVLAFADGYLRSLGLSRFLLVVNTMGTVADRVAYTGVLRSYLSDHRDDLPHEDREKVDRHPLRVLDSKREETRAVTADAPKITDHLGGEAVDHFGRVTQALGALDIPFALEPRLVRGLDYYVHTTFEFQSSALGSAQNTILAGGRYDGLVEQLGGPPTPAIGFGSGIERVLLACDAEEVFPLERRQLDAFVVDVAGGQANALARELRGAGIRTDRAYDGRSMKAQMKAANRSGAVVAVIVGEQEVADGTIIVRDLRPDRGQHTIERPALVSAVRELLEDPS